MKSTGERDFFVRAPFLPFRPLIILNGHVTMWPAMHGIYYEQEWPTCTCDGCGRGRSENGPGRDAPFIHITNSFMASDESFQAPCHPYEQQ